VTTKPLTTRQAAFVREYLVDLNATAAAERAGYTAKSARYSARDIMVMPHVKAAVDAEMAARAVRTDETQDGVIADLNRVGKAAEDAGKYDAAIRAIELRGKHLGMFKVQAELSGPGGAPIEHRGVTSLTDEELLTIAKGKRT
jgi:phage terminase small subunit